MTMLTQLENYYRECGILSTDFRCKHECDCRRAFPPTPPDANPEDEARWRKTFTEAKSAFVGDLYRDSVPRLLFVSMDPGSALSKKDPAYNYVSDISRSPQGVRDGEMNRAQRMRDRIIHPSPRLRGTNALAALILGKPDAEAMRHYAHVNSVKCTLNLPSRGKAPQRMFDNCRDYIAGEIAALIPHAIVSLGREVGETLTHITQGEDAAHIFEHSPKAQIVSLKGRDFFWIHSPHPSARDGSFQEFMRKGVAPMLERLNKFASPDS